MANHNIEAIMGYDDSKEAIREQYSSEIRNSID